MGWSKTPINFFAVFRFLSSFVWMRLLGSQGDDRCSSVRVQPKTCDILAYQ
jgi:hypothetical protein